MGREIVYCELCGNKIIESEFDDGKAVALGTRNFCSKCIDKAKEAYPDQADTITKTQELAIRRAKAAKRESAQRQQPRTSGVSTREREALRGIPSMPRATEDAGKKKKQIIYISCGVGAVILIIILAVAFSGGGEAVKNSQSGNTTSVNNNVPTSKDALLKEAWAYYDSRNYDVAFGKFSEFIQKDQSNADAYYGRGLTNKNPDDAIQDFGKAIQLKPDYFKAYLKRAHAYRENRGLDEATNDYDKIIGSEKDIKEKDLIVEAYLWSGYIKKQKGKLVEAKSDYQKALDILKLIPEKAGGYNASIERYISEADAAIERQKAVMGEDQRKKAEELADKAWNDIKTNDFDGAIEKLTDAIKIHPTFARAYFYMAWAKRDKDDLKGAIEYFGKAIELDHRYAEAYEQRGETKIQMGDIEGAIQDFKKIVELEPLNALEIAGVCSKHGYAKLTTNDFKNAVIFYDKALEFGGSLSNLEKADCYKGRGMAKKNNNDLKGALDDLNKAIELDPAQEQYLRSDIKEIEEKSR